MSESTAPILIEQRVERPQVEPYARRVTTDGAFLEYSGTSVDYSGGAPRYQKQEPKWRLQWRLSPRDLDELRAAIHQSGFDKLEKEYRPSGTSIGGSNVTWTALVNGKSHAVRLVGSPDVKLPEIDELEGTLNRILQRAADAASAAGEL